MSTKTLLLRCECMFEHLDIDLWFTNEVLDEESYLSIHTRFTPRGWRWRLKAIWRILRGYEHEFSEVILKPADVRAIAEFTKEAE